MSKLSEQVASLEAELAELKKQVAAEKEWPQAGDKYWLVSAMDAVHCNIWDSQVIDKGYQRIGNFYRTEAEACSEAESRRVIQELRQCEGARKFKINENNYSLDVDMTTQKVDVGCRKILTNGFGQVYFTAHKQAQAAALKVGHGRIVAAENWLACGEVMK